MTQNALKTFRFVRLALMASVGLPFILASNAFAQLAAPAAPAEPAAPGAPAAEVERVIVTGSNIPTAEETGPNPVDTYRPQDIEKLGIRNSTDLQEFIPQQAGGTVNLNIGNGGDGTVQLNLRGLLPKETLVLIDGKRFASGSIFGGYDVNLIPFSIVDHIDILKDGASAVYGSDAVAGVVNFFLIHKFRGLEIGGNYGNTNLGASNEMGEWESWIKAGTGDDKTDIVVVADFYQRLNGVFSRDRDISSNGNFVPFGGFDQRSGNEPGRVGSFRLIPKLFFGANSPPPHSAPNVQTSPYYINPNLIAPYPDGNYQFYNFAALTPALPPADRQTFYGSFKRDLCDQYLVVFGDFKYSRSFFNSSLAPAPFTPDPFHVGGGGDLGANFSPAGFSVPIQNAFNPFTVGNATLDINGVPTPMTTGVRFRGLENGLRYEKFTYNDIIFDVGLKGELGEFADYLKTWNWEMGFRYSRNEGEDLSLNEVSQPGLRAALLDTDPATAFNPFLGQAGVNTKAARNRVYVNLHNSGQYELPLGYLSINGDLFNLPAGPVSFAVGGEYHGERWNRYPDSLNTSFQTIGSVDSEAARVNRDVWGMYQEVRVPFTSPTWNFPGFYSFEVDFAEREEWYSQNTSATSTFKAAHSQYNAQRPKVSVRWQPIDPKYIGAVTLRGSYTEAFHAPTLQELSPAGQQSFPSVVDPFSSQTEQQVEERITGNPLLIPEVAYEWTYGAVWSPKWIKGMTLSADWWHIDMRSIVSSLGAQFIIETNRPPPFPAVQNGPLVFRAPSTIPGEAGPITLVNDPSFNLAGAIFEGLDYEWIYILDSSIFGHGDFGRLTTTINGTHLARAELQQSPDTKRFGIAGEFLPTGFSLTSSLPRDRANGSMYYDGPADTWAAGLDIGFVTHWTGQYEDDNISLVGGKPQTPRTDPVTGEDGARARKVREWFTYDVIASYTFNLPPPAPAEVPGFAKDGGKNVKSGKDGKEKNVIPVSTAEYGCRDWKWWLNNTTISLGLQNITDEEPPFVAGAFENGYDESLATIKGRFWYVGLKKRF